VFMVTTVMAVSSLLSSSEELTVTNLIVRVYRSAQSSTVFRDVTLQRCWLCSGTVK